MSRPAAPARDTGTLRYMNEPARDVGPPVARAVVVTNLERLAHADRTAATFLAHHLGGQATVVVVDDRFGELGNRSAPPGLSRRAVHAEDLAALNRDEREFARLTLIHPTPDRVRLLRPLVLSSELDRVGGAPIISLPDDAEVLGPLDAFFSAAVSVGAALVATRRSPVPVDGRLPDRHDLITAGRIDQEVVALSGEGGAALVQWWAQGVLRRPFDDPLRFDPATHVWLDDALFEMRHVVRVLPPALVRSYRNLDEVTDAALNSDQQPLVVRFPGHRLDQPWQLSEHSGTWPRTLLSARPVLAALLAQRTQAITACPDASAMGPTDPYAHLSTGHPVDSAMRASYRTAILAAERHSLTEPPNPFLPGEQEAFVNWLAEPVDGVGRYLRALRDVRPDLARSFATDDGALALWGERDGRRGGVWPRLLERPPPHDVGVALDFHGTALDEVAPQRDLAGVNVVGLLTAELGVGETGRNVLRAIERSGVPHSVVVDQATANRRQHPLDSTASAGFRYDVDIVIVNADVLAATLSRHGRAGQSERPTIGVWSWELTQFPTSMHPAFALLDEVWVPTQFMLEGIAVAAAEHGVEVFVVPVHLPYVRVAPPAADVRRVARAHGIPDDCPCFMFAFDYLSVAERKNPWGVVDAFCQAFPLSEPGGPVLVLKSINHEFKPMEREHLLHAVGHRPDIVLVEQYLDIEERDLLLARADCYVSLHRSEGLGLTMAEAMGLAIPVIATGWSGNLDFMTADNSHLVSSELVPIGPEVEVYAGLGCWAQPSVAHAAELMRAVVADPAAAAARGQRGQRDLQQRNAGDADARFIIERLRAVRTSRRKS